MILRCPCGRIKRGPQQPFRSTSTKPWMCPDCRTKTVRMLTVVRRTITSPIKVILFEGKRSVIGTGGIHGLVRRFLGKTG